MIQIVVCAAMKKGEIIVAGARHYDMVMRSQIEAMNVGSHGWEQGFIDQKGKFLTREEAWKIADAAGQIRRPTGWEKDYNNPRNPNIGDTGVLFSENLY